MLGPSRSIASSARSASLRAWSRVALSSAILSFNIYPSTSGPRDRRRRSRSSKRQFAHLTANVAHSANAPVACAASMGWTNRQAVVLFRTSCGASDPSMHFCRPTAAHLAPFYLAIARSAVSSSPFLRGPSPNCDQTKPRPSAAGAGSAHVRCSPICRVFGDHTRVACCQVDRSQGAGETAAVLGLCRWGAGRRPAGARDDCGPQSDLMIAAYTIDLQRPPNCHESRCVSFGRPAPCSSSAVS
jgi:hypothetical protein